MNEAITYLKAKFPTAEVWECIWDKDFILVRTMTGKSLFYKENGERFNIGVYETAKIHIDTVNLEILKEKINAYFIW